MTTAIKNICLFLILFFSINLFAQTNLCGIKNKTTHSGEILNYKIYYTLAGAYVGAGEVSFSSVFTLLNNKPVFHLKGEGGTYKSYDWFFKVRDIYESFIDTTTMLPLKFSRNVSEGKNKLYNQVLFNRNTNTAVSTNKIINVPACVQDVLSAIYFARNIDYSSMKINDKLNFNLYLDDVVYSIYITYLGKEKITTKYGTYNTIKFRPKLIEGTIFKGGEKMTVYVTDDDKKIPVYIETPILIGSIRVYLNERKN